MNSADPLRRAQRGERLSPDEKWRIRRSEAETTRRRRDRLKGQPQERQHSAAVRRDAGPTAPGEGYRIFLREGSLPKAETRHPDSSGICGALGALRLEPDRRSRTRYGLSQSHNSVSVIAL
jgi:hypothetical protein